MAIIKHIHSIILYQTSVQSFNVILLHGSLPAVDCTHGVSYDGMSILLRINFYGVPALLAVQTAVITWQICLPVCPSVRHLPVFCPDE